MMTGFNSSMSTEMAFHWNNISLEYFIGITFVLIEVISYDLFWWKTLEINKVNVCQLTKCVMIIILASLFFMFCKYAIEFPYYAEIWEHMTGFHAIISLIGANSPAIFHPTIFFQEALKMIIEILILSSIKNKNNFMV